MRVAIPHKLGLEQARERLRKRVHEIADHVPGGVAEVETGWTGTDTMDLTIRAMGQTLRGELTVEESEVVITMDLPFALSFVEPMIVGAIRENGQKLLS